MEDGQMFCPLIGFGIHQKHLGRAQLDPPPESSATGRDGACKSASALLLPLCHLCSDVGFYFGWILNSFCPQNPHQVRDSDCGERRGDKGVRWRPSRGFPLLPQAAPKRLCYLLAPEGASGRAALSPATPSGLPGGSGDGASSALFWSGKPQGSPAGHCPLQSKRHYSFFPPERVKELGGSPSGFLGESTAPESALPPPKWSWQVGRGQFQRRVLPP